MGKNRKNRTEKINIVERVLKKRLEDEKRGIATRINIGREMKEVLENNFSSAFSPYFPYRLHCLAFKDRNGLNAIPIKRVKVIDKDKILIECEREIKGRVSLLALVHSNFKEEEGCLFTSYCEIEKMKGWQFKGIIKPYGKNFVLEVDEIYCAISGKKLQEKLERYRIKLVEAIVNFFYEVSGRIALSLADSVLKDFGVEMQNGKVRNSEVLKKMKSREFDKLISMLIKTYSQVYGSRLAKSLPWLLGKLSESLRIKPKKVWKI